MEPVKTIQTMQGNDEYYYYGDEVDHSKEESKQMDLIDVPNKEPLETF